MSNKNLHKAKKNKKDEFYTSLSVIEDELKHYNSHFENKVVLCNCDDPRISNFFHYFFYNFDRLKLKKLIAICYKNQILEMFSEHKSEQAIYLIYEGNKNDNRIPNIEDIETKDLKGDGDFRSPECIELLKQADIVCTNPPFSLFSEYISQLFKYKKKFLIMGNTNEMFYIAIFPHIISQKIWLGYSFNITAEFQIPKEYKKWDRIKNGIKYAKVPGICWFTNLHHKKQNQDLILVKKYYGNEKEYPKYDTINAIEVGYVKLIPEDYYGVMAVPSTFLGIWNPKQFEIVGSHDKPLLNGKEKYLRLLIRRKSKNENRSQ